MISLHTYLWNNLKRGYCNRDTDTLSTLHDTCNQEMSLSFLSIWDEIPPLFHLHVKCSAFSNQKIKLFLFWCFISWIKYNNSHAMVFFICLKLLILYFPSWAIAYRIYISRKLISNSKHNVTKLMTLKDCQNVNSFWQFICRMYQQKCVHIYAALRYNSWLTFIWCIRPILIDAKQTGVMANIDSWNENSKKCTHLWCCI